MESSRLSRLALRQGGERGISASSGWARRTEKARSERSPLVRVVETFEDLEHVLALRSAAALSADPPVNHTTDVDDGDFGATHLLGFIGSKPAGCLRLRVFEGHAVIDRVVLGRCPSRSALLFHLRDMALRLCNALDVRAISEEFTEAHRLLLNEEMERVAVYGRHADSSEILPSVPPSKRATP